MIKRAAVCVFLSVAILFCSGGASPARDKQEVAPNFKLKDLNQAQVELQSFRNKSPVILFFWTTWCPYCIRELKQLNSLTEDLNKEGIELISINSGEPAAKVARLAKNFGIKYPIYLDEDSKVTDSYGIFGVPTFFVIDKKGFIRTVGNSFPHEEAKKLLSEK